MTIRRETDGADRRHDGMTGMTTRHCLLLLAVALTACGESGAGKTAYVGGTLWNGTGTPPIPDAVIIVEGGRIDRAGPPDAVRVPRGATEVRVDGKWIIPGLIDAHAHTERWMLARFLTYGVTSVRDMGGRQDSIVALRDETSLGSIPSPRLFIAGAVIGAGPTTAHEARRAIDDRALIDATHAKVYTQINAVLLAAILDEANMVSLPVAGHLGKIDALRAARLGVRSIEHLSGVVEATVPNRAPFLAAHDDFFGGWSMAERAWAALDSAALAGTANALKGTGVAMVPTLVQHEALAHIADREYRASLDLAGVPDPVRQAWNRSELARGVFGLGEGAEALRQSRAAQDRFVRLFKRVGGLVAAGTDTPGPLLAPGASLHQELALLVAAGFTPREALLAATRDAARLMGVDSIGVIEEGAVADFVVLSASPLDDISNTRKVEAVVTRGVRRRWVELRALW